MQDLINHVLTSGHLGDASALLVIGLIAIFFYQAHKSEKNSFYFPDLFLDQKTGKIGGSEFRINVAFMVTSWALIFLTLKGNLTEWFIAAYLTAFVADRMFSRKSNSGAIVDAKNTEVSSTTTSISNINK